MHRSMPYVRPGFWLKDVFSPVITRLGLTPVLTTLGRRSGQPHSIPIGGPFTFEGRRYLVSGRGSTHWARNLRAAGWGELRLHGRTERFRAVEVAGDEHDAVVTAYRESLGHSVDAYFARIPDPADHPVFRMEPMEAGSGRIA
jgi:deazaflavin-dependent oxidoreductase (nitroreductase family)